MDYTFEYDAEVEESYDVLYSVEFKMGLNAEQSKRLEASFNTGKYMYLCEDDSIEDIYYSVLQIAELIDEATPAEPGLEEVARVVTNICYPKEFGRTV